jgi:outer membrane lipoprotein-sorting protein
VIVSARRREVLALAVLLAITPSALAGAAEQALSPEDSAVVARAVAYLEGLTSAKGRFVQTDQRGERAGGVLYLQRPGRARFEYAPPSGLVITSDGKTVVVSNPQLKTFQHYPLNATPLGLFLAKQIRLDRGARVTAVARSEGGFAITASDVRGEAQGQITLSFADNPLRLTGWTIADAQRRVTRVDLQDLAPVGDLPADLFVQTRPSW